MNGLIEGLGNDIQSSGGGSGYRVLVPGLWGERVGQFNIDIMLIFVISQRHIIFLDSVYNRPPLILDHC